MKVLLIVEPGRDGVFRHVESLALSLLDSGVEVALIYSSVRGSDRLQELTAKLAATGADVLDLRISNAPSLGDLVALCRIKQFILRVQPSLIHAHSSKAGALARLLPLIGIGLPTFYTPNAYYGMGKSGAKAWLFNGIERILGRSGLTINVSHDEADFAREILGIGPDRQRIIANGVDTDFFRPARPEMKLELCARYGIPSSATVLGTVGRFSEQKDYSTLYYALVPLLKAHPNLHFIHVGSGSIDTKIALEIRELGISSQIRQIQYLQNTLPVYQLIDGFVLSSRYEGLSYAILEALACDVPLILSDAPGNREFRLYGLSHCHWASIGDIRGFTDAITAWLQDNSSKRLCNHRRIAEQHFSLSASCSKITAAYGESVPQWLI